MCINWPRCPRGSGRPRVCALGALLGATGSAAIAGPTTDDGWWYVCMIGGVGATVLECYDGHVVQGVWLEHGRLAGLMSKLSRSSRVSQNSANFDYIRETIRVRDIWKEYARGALVDTITIAVAMADMLPKITTWTHILLFFFVYSMHGVGARAYICCINCTHVYTRRWPWWVSEWRLWVGEKWGKYFWKISRNRQKLSRRYPAGEQWRSISYASYEQTLRSGLMIVFGLGGGDPTDAPHPGRGEPRASTCTDGCWKQAEDTRRRQLSDSAMKTILAWDMWVIIYTITGA